MRLGRLRRPEHTNQAGEQQRDPEPAPSRQIPPMWSPFHTG
jgi:hypothetical protein